MARKKQVSKTAADAEKEAKEEYEAAQTKHQEVLTKRRMAELEVELAQDACDAAQERLEQAESDRDELSETDEEEAAEAANEAFKKLAKIQMAARGRVDG